MSFVLHRLVERRRGELRDLMRRLALEAVPKIREAIRCAHEETWCDGCKKFSRGPYCPNCPGSRRNDG